MASTHLHEAAEDLRPETREMHRAIASLIEELEAVDWYDQRIDAAGDEELREILRHNRDEEKEHAAMVLEWLRRQDGEWDRFLRMYLFTDGPIRDQGEMEEGGGGSPGGESPAAGSGSLGLGNLSGKETL